MNAAEPQNVVLVTRPEPSASAFSDFLQQRGFKTLIQPMLDIQALPESALQSAKNQVLALNEFHALIFISLNAVKHGMALIDQYWPQFPLGVQCFAIGSATAAALQDWGVAAQAADQAMNSETLLALPELAEPEVSGRKILLVKGMAGREMLAEELGKRGAAVEVLECYQRLPVQLNAAGFQKTLQQQDVNILTATSGESLKNLQSLLAEEQLQWPLIVPGQRVATLAQAMGFSTVVVAENAGMSAMLAALEQLPQS